MSKDSPAAGKKAAKQYGFTTRRIFLLIFALIFAALCILVYFRKQQENRDHLTQHNIRHLGTITTLIEERLNAFTSSMSNLRYASNSDDLSEQSIRKNFPFDVDITYAAASTAASHPDTLTVTRDHILYRVTLQNLGMQTLHIRTTFAELLNADEITDGSYDILLITNITGDTVYFNSNPELLKIGQIDSMRVRKFAQRFRAAAVNTNAGNISIADRSYECYIQPMRDFRICGLLSTEAFEDKAQAVPSNYVVTALIILAILLLATPLVSLRFISMAERVKPIDIFLSILGVAVGSAFVTLLLLEGIYLKYNFDEDENRVLKSIADSVSTRALSEFSAVDTMIAELAELNGGHLRVRPRSGMFSETYGPVELDAMFMRYPYFEQLYWLDPEGFLRVLWTTTDQQYSRVPLADREYFRKIKEGESHWVQPHYSRGTSRFMVAYSSKAKFNFNGSPSDTSLLVSVDFLPRSLVNVHLPEGFGYSVVDKSGLVLFHSTQKRSLHENMFAECDDDALRELVNVGESGYLRARYWENDVRMYATPMKIHDQSWYLVVYADQRILADRKSGTLIMSMVLYLLFFLPVIVGYTVFLFVRDRHLAWMWFQSGRIREYVILTLSLILMSCICVVASLSVRNLPLALIIGCVIPHIGLLTGFYWLDSCVYPAAKFSYKGRTSFSFVSQRRMVVGIHIAALFLYLYAIFTNTKVLGNGNATLEDYAPVTLALLILAVGLLMLAMLKLMRGARSRRVVISELPRRRKQWYFAFLSALTLLLGIVPMFLFFRVSHDVHAIAYNRVMHTSLRNFMIRRDRDIHSTQRNRILTLKEARFPIAQLYRDNTTDLYLDRGIGARLDSKPLNARYIMFNDSLLSVLMLPLNQSASSLRAHMKGHRIQQPIVVGTDTLYYRSRPGLFSAVPSEKTLFPLMFLTSLGLLFLYQTIRFSARRLFLMDISRLDWKHDPMDTRSCAFIWTIETEAELFRAIRRPTFDIISEKAADDTWLAEARRSILDSVVEDQPIVIDHFDYRAEDSGFNILKLELLELLLITHGRQVCIMCSVDPEYYLLQPDSSSASIELQERWKRVLNMMLRLYPPIVRLRNEAGNSEPGDSDPLGPDAAASTRFSTPGVSSHSGQMLNLLHPRIQELHRILAEECFHENLQSAGMQARELIGEGKINSRDDIFTWIGTQCRPFYQSLWMTFTKKEQLVLYHLAKDGFVPFPALDIVQQLLHRQIVFMDPALRLFNETFRQFILSARTYEQIRRWEEEEPASFWSSIKHPMFVGVTAIAAVLLYSNPGYFDSTIAVLTALAAALPLVLRLRGFVTGGKLEP